MKKYDKFILTFGYGRTGSTIIGHILNNHPNCYMSTEYRFLARLLKKEREKENENDLIKSLLQQAKRDYQHNIPPKANSKHQKDSLDIEFKKLKKNTITCIGDKKSGGNTILSMNNHSFFEKFYNDNKNIYFIINIRNPIDILNSVERMRKIKGNQDEEFKKIISCLNYSINIYKKYRDRSIIIYYEDLIGHTENTLMALFNSLNLKHYTELSSYVNNDKKILKSTMPKKHIQIINDLVEKENIKYFNRYLEL